MEELLPVFLLGTPRRRCSCVLAILGGHVLCKPSSMTTGSLPQLGCAIKDTWHLGCAIKDILVCRITEEHRIQSQQVVIGRRLGAALAAANLPKGSRPNYEVWVQRVSNV